MELKKDFKRIYFTKAIKIETSLRNTLYIINI